MELKLLVSPFTNGLDRIESKSLFVGSFTNPNCTKSKSFNDNYCKSNGTNSKSVGGEEVEKDDFKGPK